MPGGAESGVRKIENPKSFYYAPVGQEQAGANDARNQDGFELQNAFRSEDGRLEFLHGIANKVRAQKFRDVHVQPKAVRVDDGCGQARQRKAEVSD